MIEARVDVELEGGHDQGLATFHDVHYTLQEYLSLEDQHEELHQRLSALCPPARVSPSRSNASRRGGLSQAKPTEPSFRPLTRPPISVRGTPSPVPRVARSYFTGDSVAPAVHYSGVEQVAADEQMLSNVNEGIKRTLTELLNCDVVRRDVHTRVWVQTRLLETERELRRGRRRRSSGSSDSFAVAD